MLIDTTNSLIKSSGKYIAAIGLEDMVVVATDDVVLICPRERAQEIKEIVDMLQKGSSKKYL